MVTKKVVKKVVKKTAKKKSVVGKIKTPKFVCYHCKNEVHELDNQVFLTTSNKGKIVQEVIFHMDCWKEYFENPVPDYVLPHPKGESYKQETRRFGFLHK